ncbi:MAG: hypothetical protein VX528_11265, partial [Candidatus Latescibacterota bacterium]|nr:hypothetical protein [Candidatus Latescibacterota bacterium]
ERISQLFEACLASDGPEEHFLDISECLCCLPAGGEVTFGENEPWDHMVNRHGKTVPHCHHPRICPWCFYRRFQALYRDIAKTGQKIAGVELTVNDPNLSVRQAGNWLKDAMYRLRNDGITKAWMRVWPNFDDEQRDDGSYPSKGFLIAATDQPLRLPFPKFRAGIQLIDPTESSRFAILDLPKLYHFDRQALPDSYEDFCAFRESVRGLPDIQTLHGLKLPRG